MNLNTRVKTETRFIPAKLKLSSGKVEGILETNGNVVILISETGDNETALYRLVVDGKLAILKQEEKIATVKKIALKNEKIKSLVDSLPELAVSKDVAGEYYAVALFNNNLNDTSKRIEIILYGNDNKEINRASYSAKKEKFKNLQYIDMAVIGPDRVAALFYGYNREASRGKNRRDDISYSGERGFSNKN